MTRNGGKNSVTKSGVSFTAFLLVLPLPAGAQELTISGTVADQTGGVLPGVTVEAVGPGLADGPRVAVTGGEGRYALDGLPAGDYSVSFTLSGFETLQRDGVSAAGPDGAALDVVLQFASFSEDVTVVGSKLDTGRQEFGTSVAYMGQERLESDAIFTVEDAFNRTANAFTGTAQFGAYSIRGVNNNGLDSGFGNANALASILLNQTAVGPRTGDYLNPSLFDVGSVEILRGPQSTLQGPNSLIGAVLINYNKAAFDGYDGRVRLEGGGLGTRRVQVMQNAELVDDVLAARLTFEDRYARGAATNLVTGDEDVQRTDEQTIRGQVAFRPRADDDIRFDFTWLHNESDSNPFALVVPNEAAGITLQDRQQPWNRPDQYPSSMDFLNLETHVALDDHWMIDAVTGYSRFDLTQKFDADLSRFDFLNVDAAGHDAILSQEVRAAYRGDSVDGLIGLFYSEGDYSFGFHGTGIFPDGMGGVAPFNRQTRLLEEVDQLGVFGRAEWSASERVLLTGGVRLNRETRRNDNFADNNGLTSDLSAEKTFSQVLPSGSLAYSLTPSTSLGVSYARGYKAGGFAFAVFLGVAEAYGEEFTDNYEVFVRHRTADGRLTLNANVFAIDWREQQIPYTAEGGFPGFDALIANAGRSALRGVEVESEYYASSALNVFASFGVTDSEFIDFVLDGTDLGGRAFPQSPAWNGAFGLGWRDPRGWFASGTFSYTDDAYTEIAAPVFTQVSSRRLLGGRVGYERSGWSVYLWGTNLLDDQYELALFDGRLFGLGAVYGRMADPRAVGAGVDFDW